MRLIESSHLKNWASQRTAQGQLPHLVKSLILAVIEPAKIRMPSGDAVWVPGFDGVVISSETNRFVPNGVSGWEMGTDPDFKGKADRDYEKRSQASHDDGAIEKKTGQQISRSEATYVCVTPYIWVDKEDWVSKRRAEGIWEDVKVVDGVELQDWLELAPAVSVQYASAMNVLYDEGICSLNQAWDEWSQLTDPASNEAIVIAGREEQEKDLIQRLAQPPNIFVVRGDSPREAWGFALGAMRRLTPEDVRMNLDARTIVVDSEQVITKLRSLKNHIVVLKGGKEPVSGTFMKRGCHVIIPEGIESRSDRNLIALTRPTHGQFADALKQMGFGEDEAHRVARACGLSITVLQRLHAHAKGGEPPWSFPPDAIDLIPALLAGRWSNRNNSDREMMCLLSGVNDYEAVEQKLQRYLWVDEPPLRKFDDMWTLTAPVDAFQLLARQVTPTDPQRFENAFRQVFGRIDPKVEIPPDDWIYQDLKGEQGHSSWLRSGLAETLLLIAERGKDADLKAVPSTQSYADSVVRGLPGLRDDWRLLASLSDHYAILMEATPSPLLDSLEHLLEAKPDEVRRIFVKEGMLGGGALHTGLLWGLEAIAWSPDNLPRVSLILARLARLDPGGRMVNRPNNSLHQIYLWWLPGTNASIDQKLGAIDLILDYEPAIGWILLAYLLPTSQMSISHGTARPRRRDFGDPPEETRTNRGQFRYISGIFDRALERVDFDPKRWQRILDSLRVLNAEQQERTIAKLRSIGSSSNPSDVKLALWEVVRDFAYQHRTYQEANWAVGEQLITRLESLLPELAPTDAIEQNRWLFDDWFPNLPLKYQEIEERQIHIDELRRKAAAEVLSAQGLQGLVKLGTACKYPGFVAVAATSLLPDLNAVRDWVKLAIASGDVGIGFAAQISWQAEQIHHEKWRSLVRAEAATGVWAGTVLATLLSLWPYKKETWLEADALGIRAEYWRGSRVFTLDRTAEENAFAIDRMIEAQRSIVAFHQFAVHPDNVPTDALVRLFDAAMQQLSQAQTAEEVTGTGMNSYELRNFLRELSKRAELSREDVALREYQVIPLLGLSDSQGLLIHDLMAEDPDFFVEQICVGFHPHNRDKSTDKPLTVEQEGKARAALSLLQGMNRIPGMGQKNQVDQNTLLDWVEAVRQRAEKMDRKEIAEQYVGKILAHSPDDPQDGGWPHQVVRNVIDKLSAPQIQRGLMIECVNMRGVVSRSLYEGGAQERVLAEQYRKWAEISRSRWPKTATMLDGFAKDWESEADREDIRAEQDKLE